MLKRILFFFALAIMASPLLFGQITTSSISGVVKNTSNEPLVGSSIVATHLPSGTKYTTTSRNGGQYSITNMQPGGPYLIEITFVGFEKEKVEDVFLTLAETFNLDPQLKKLNTTLENVVITTAGRNKLLNSSRTGAVTNIGVRQITQTPSISRSINDLTRATPQSSNNAFGGGNYRQSNFTVDGAEFNNSFGIGTGNLPAGGSPISLDALDEISVNITPFDVRQSGFIGSAINAVTRSGTNTITGSVYTYFRTEKQRGRRVEKTYFTRPIESFKQRGVRIGGPIIKNKLFFFLNYETENTPRTLQTRVAATAAKPFGSADNVARPTADSLNYISQYLATNYGYITGPYDNYTPNVERKKFLGRIDWNISPKNRFNIRYSQVIGGTPLAMSTSLNSAGSSVAGNGATRGANTALWFSNSNYFQGEDFYSLSAELNSKLGRVSNTLRGTYTFQNENRRTNSQLFPFVDILSTTGVTPQAGSGLGAPYTSFGYEPFSFGNLRNVKVYSVVDNLSWTKNKHNWTVGFQFETSKTINGFQPFGTSYYRFATWADFESALNPNPALRKLPTDFTQTFSLSKDFAAAFSAFKYTNYSVYGQDEISVNKDFKLTVGLRLELPTYPDLPQIVTNPLLLGLTFANGEKLDQGVLPKNRIMWSPRIGFNWDLYGDRSLQIRGGTGIFTGKTPYVWIVSQSGTNNMIQVTQAFNAYTSAGLPSGQVIPGPFNPNPIAYRPGTVPAAGTSVNAAPTVINPDFRNPQSWKSSLAIDTKLPGGIIGTLEAIFNKDLFTIYPRNPNLVAPTPMNIAGYPDNRMVYGATVQTRLINTLAQVGSNQVPQAGGSIALLPTVLDNGKRGYYFSITAKLEKSFSKGLFASVAYAKSMAGNLHDGGGDQPNGVLSGTPTLNGTNFTPLSYADYVVPDRVIGLFSYRKEYFKHLATTFSLVYTGSINGRFSYTYGGDVNRDGTSGNDLIYIPKDARNTSEITFTSQTVNGVTYSAAQQGQLFEDYINQDKYLKAHRGQYAERNGAQQPWLNRVDVKFMQDLFAKIGKNKNTVQFTIDVFNFGNMLNPSWGKLKTVNAPFASGINSGAQILTATLPTGFAPGGTIVPTFRLPVVNGQIITRTFRDNVSVNSTYSVQFGLRYLFN